MAEIHEVHQVLGEKIELLAYTSCDVEGEGCSVGN